MKISLVINIDNRPVNHKFTGVNLGGCVDDDFIIDGILNKQKFLYGFEYETIIHLDKHTDVSYETIQKLQEISDTLIVRKHTSEHGFNCNNYIRALEAASGDTIIHFDADTVAFSSSYDETKKYIDLLNNHTVVSYPHWFSPNPDVNDNYDYWWASTRMFMCKRETLDLSEIKKCLSDNDYMYSTYPASVRNPWFEHSLGLLAKYRGNGVFYPPLDYSETIVFSWGSYESGLLKKLNNMSYQEVAEWQKSHPMYFPNDVNA